MYKLQFVLWFKNSENIDLPVTDYYGVVYDIKERL